MNRSASGGKHTLAHSLNEDSDYIFINPRQVWRTVIGHKTLLLVCIIACMALTQIYTFFFRGSHYVSEAHLKVEGQQSLSLSPLLDQMGPKGQNVQRLNTILDDFNSASFFNNVVKEYLRARLPMAPLLPRNRSDELLTWIYKSKKNNTPIEMLFSSPNWLEIVESVRGKLSTHSNPEANAIFITATTKNPQLSANLVNIAARVLAESNFQRLREKAGGLKEFVSRQTKEKKRDLYKLELELIEFQKKYKMAGNADSGTESYTVYNSSIEALDVSQRKLQTLNRMIAQTELELKKINQDITDPKLSNTELYLTQLQYRLNILQYQVTLIRQTPDASKDELAALETELEQTAAQYKLAVTERKESGGYLLTKPLDYYKDLEKNILDLKRQKQQIAIEVKTLSESIALKESSLEQMPEIMQRLSSLKRQIQAQADLYLNLQTKQQEVEIMEAGITNDLSIISKGTPPKYPVGLTVGVRYFVSALVGLFIGLLFLVLKNTLVQTVKGYRDMQDHGIIVLGEIPLIPSIYVPLMTPLARKIERFSKQVAEFSPTLNTLLPKFEVFKENFGLSREPKNRQNELVVLDQPNSSEADIFRYLRLRLNSYVQDNLGASTKDGGAGTVILVTSPTESLGKTFITTNLAASFGKGDVKTLLIDLDLRNSSVKRVFKSVDKKCGIGNLSACDLENENCIVKINEYFDVLFCASKINNPTEILESLVLRNFIHKQREKYDYIFIDSPPVLAVCDPSLLAPIADLVMIVVGYDITFKEDIQLAIDGLNTGKQRPMVGVVNMVNRGFDKYSYYYNQGGEDAA